MVIKINFKGKKCYSNRNLKKNLSLLLILVLNLCSFICLVDINNSENKNTLENIKSYDLKSANSNRNFVISVECINVTILDGETNVSITLSKGQNITNCVPFVTMKYSGGDDFGKNLGDVYFKSDPARIIVARSDGTSSSSNFHIYVVEFDASKIIVQQGNFNFSTTTYTKSINTVNLSKAVVLSYWNSSNGVIQWDSGMISTHFSSVSQLTFQRFDNDGSITGHYYIFEARNNEFSVQQVYIALGFAETTDFEDINNVNMSKTFIISSFFSTEASSNPLNTACDVWLYNASCVAASRYGLNYAIYIRAFIISFSNDSSEFVQRGMFTYSSGVYERQTNINPIDLEKAMLSSNRYGGMRSSANQAGCFAQYYFIDNDTIKGERGDNSDESESHWEVVEWGLIIDKPRPFKLFTTDAEKPADTDGNFNLNWTVSYNADNFSIYQLDYYTEKVNNSMVPFDTGLENHSYVKTGLEEGVYYYILLAINKYGNESSNCIGIEVSKIPIPFFLSSDAETPSDSDGTFILNWTDAIYCRNYSIYRHDSYFTELKGDETLVISGLKGLSHPIEALEDGLHYFLVIAYNKYNSTNSNCIDIMVLISDSSSGGDDGNLFIIPIILISMSIIGSITTIIIVKRRSQKKILPPRKKILLKSIIPHIKKISSSQLVFEKEESQKKTIEKELINEKKVEDQLNKIKILGEELFSEGAYLEAQKQFELLEKLLIKLGRKEEALLYSELIIGIKELNEERERRLEMLTQEKLEGNTIKIFSLYFDIIEISKKLKDRDAVNMYQSELTQLFQADKEKEIDLEYQRLILEEKANSLQNDNLFENAAELYEKCEKISQFLVQLGRNEEITNIEKFKNKRNECLKDIPK